MTLTGFGAENIDLPNTTNADMKYRILHRSSNDEGVFYIGGRGIFHRIDPFGSCKIAVSVCILKCKG